MIHVYDSNGNKKEVSVLIATNKDCDLTYNRACCKVNYYNHTGTYYEFEKEIPREDFERRLREGNWTNISIHLAEDSK